MGLSFVLLPTLIQVGVVASTSLNQPAGFVFSNAIQTPPPAIEQPVEFPPLTKVLISKGPIAAPALWGQQLVGFDLVQKDFAQEELSPVTVYVADAGVARGASRKLELKGHPYQQRRISLKTTFGSSNPLVQRVLDRVLKRVEMSIPDPTDTVPLAHPTHGTHVAGLIGSGISEVGGGRTNTVVDLDIFKGVGRYRFENLVDGLQQIETENASSSIVNLSVETSNQREIADGLRSLTQKTDAIVVLASGNSGIEFAEDSVPTLFEEGLTVGALSLSGVRASFSNYGKALDLVAPGEQILSRGEGIQWSPESLEVLTGTSFAAPIVSGAAAIVRSILPEASREDVKKILIQTAVDLGLNGRDDEYGHGMVNAYRAALVAKRIKSSLQKDATSLQTALSDPKSFDTSSERREAIIEQNKSGFGTSEYEHHIRKAALLGGSAEHMESLGIYYVVQGTPLYGMGLIFAHYNHQSASPSCEDLAAAGKMVWALQNVRAVGYQDLSILRGLANKDLLFAAYSAMTPELAPLTPLFEERLMKIAPDEMSPFQILVAEKTQSSSERDQAVVVSKAE
jgi:hypothetical protein